jgi:hypothetical protein
MPFVFIFNASITLDVVQHWPSNQNNGTLNARVSSSNICSPFIVCSHKISARQLNSHKREKLQEKIQDQKKFFIAEI